MKISSICGCCSLQTGAAIAGVINFVGGLLMLIGSIINISKIIDYHRRRNHTLQMTFCDYDIAVTYFVYSIILLTVSTLLIIGATFKNSRYVFPSVCMGFTNFVMITVYIVAVLVCPQNIPLFIPESLFVSYLFYLIIYALIFYIWLITFSYYKQLMAEKYKIIFSHPDDLCEHLEETQI